jgi:hypothetical protein
MATNSSRSNDHKKKKKKSSELDKTNKIQGNLFLHYRKLKKFKKCCIVDEMDEN